MRIASLVPSTTEIVAALGLADALVARTHECDHPAAVLGATLELVAAVVLPRPLWAKMMVPSSEARTAPRKNARSEIATASAGATQDEGGLAGAESGEGERDHLDDADHRQRDEQVRRLTSMPRV